MKKFKNFPVINVKTILALLSAFILTASVAFSVCVLFVSNITSDFVNLMLQIGTKTPPSVSHATLTEAMLTLSLPGIAFAESVSSPSSEPAVIPTEPYTEPYSDNISDVSQSITYKSAEEIGYTSVDGIYINNQTTKSVNISHLLNQPLDLSSSDDPSVLIVHTHATESYTPSQKYTYTPTEGDRTTDTSYNMVSVGNVIYDCLTSNGIKVIHDTTLNDYPSYSKSYSNSLKLIQSYTEKYPSIKIVIDVHRDAIVTKDGAKLRPLASFNPPSAQVMLVIGTNDSGLNHPLWSQNLSFALKLQQKMNSLYPSLARPINLRRERFNQHLAPYSFILEVGTNGNTLDEAKEGARLFSSSLVALLEN